MTRGLTRRDVLTGAAGLSVSIAGCTIGSNPTGRESASAEQSASRIADHTVTDRAIEVELAKDHDVTTLTLVGPDGSTVRSVDVPAGARMVSVPVLELNPDISGYEHYQLGEHTLVAVAPESEQSVGISLRPDVRVTSVEQYQVGTSTTDLGKIAVSVLNEGTGPTWVYDLGFEELPGPASSRKLTSNPGLPNVETLPKGGSALVPPSEEQTYLSLETPLSPLAGEYGCSSATTTFLTRVGIVTGTTLRKQVRVHLSGEKRTVSVSGDIICTTTEVETAGEEG